MASTIDLTANVVRMKLAYRLETNAKSWPEKVASIEHMKQASVMAKQGMRQTLTRVAQEVPPREPASK